MTSDEIQLIGIQVNDANTKEANRINAERVNNDKAYQDASLALQTRTTEAEETWKAEDIRLRKAEQLINERLEELKIEYEHADRQAQISINDKIADTQIELKDIERERANNDKAYKDSLNQIQRESNYLDFFAKQESNKVSKMNAITAKYSAETNRWIEQQKLELDRSYNTEYLRLQRKKLGDEAMGRVLNFLTTHEYNKAYAQSVANTAYDRREQRNLYSRELDIRESANKSEAARGWTNVVMQPFNNLLYGISRGIASNLVSRYTGGLNGTQQTKSYRQQVEEQLFKD